MLCVVTRQPKHDHQPPGVIFGSYSCEMKPRSQLSLLFPPLYLYYCNTHRKKKPQNFHCQSVLASSTSFYPHNPGQHLSECHYPSVWLYPWSFPPFDIQLAHFSSAWSSVLWATPILEVGSESQPVWFGILIATHSLQLCLKRGDCWTQGSSSHLFWLKQKAPQWLFSETQTEMEMAGNLGLDMSGFLYLKNLHC